LSKVFDRHNCVPEIISRTFSLSKFQTFTLTTIGV
jgi:hypothetical protein